MHTYRIKLADDGIGVERTIEFEGEDTAAALNVLSTIDGGRRAELFEDGNFVCTLKQDQRFKGLWKVRGG